MSSRVQCTLAVTVDHFSFDHTEKPPEFDEKDLRYGVCNHILESLDT